MKPGLAGSHRVGQELLDQFPRRLRQPRLGDQLLEIAVRDLVEVITEAWLTQAPKKLVQEFLADSL